MQLSGALSKMEIINLSCLCWLLLSSVALGARLFREQVLKEETLEESLLSSGKIKVPGGSPAYYCSDPTDDIFEIYALDIETTVPGVDWLKRIYALGYFLSDTGSTPWLNITATINGRPELGPVYYSPLCDIDVFQEIKVKSPADDYEKKPTFHRSCPKGAVEGFAMVSSPSMMMTPPFFTEGRWDVRAEATTQDGKRIFCVEGTYNFTEE